MRALYIEDKEQAVRREVAVPEVEQDQVRIKVSHVGICGSDLHYYYELANGEFVVREPLVPGHELSGTVDADPTGVWTPGQPVTVHPARFGPPLETVPEGPHLWPGGSYLGSAATWPHTQGAAAEYLVVEAGMLRALPPELPLRRAVLAEPLAVAMHGAGRAGDLAGQRVLVAGAGPIGLLSVLATRAAGAAEVHVVDVLDEPLMRARSLGADRVANVSQAPPEPNSVDVALECSGAPASISAVLRAVRQAGTVVQVGMVPNEPRPVNLAPFIAKELQLCGSFRFNDEIDDAVALLAASSGADGIITHEFSLDEAATAFAAAKDSRRSGKVVLKPGA